MELSKGEITKIRHLEDEYGLNVTSLGSPLGKTKLLDKADGTKHDYVPFKKYLAGDVKRACELAHAFETKLVRGFSFYPPRGKDPEPHIAQAVEQLGQIAEACHRSDLTFGLEIEAGHSRPKRPGRGRNLSPGKSSGIDAGVRRRQHHLARLLAGRIVPTVPGDEAGHRLDARERLPPSANGQARERAVIATITIR